MSATDTVFPPVLGIAAVAEPPPPPPHPATASAITTSATAPPGMNIFFFMGDLLIGLVFAVSPSADARPVRILPGRVGPFGDYGGGRAAL